MSDFSELVGLTLTSVERIDDSWNGDTLVFTSDTGRVFKMYHSQDCCESVTIEDINGDFADLVGTPILVAEERYDDDLGPPEGVSEDDAHTWTFYCIRTIKGSVDIRWYGTSNGYYSTAVGFDEVK